jgi:hypothetical protein
MQKIGKNRSQKSLNSYNMFIYRVEKDKNIMYRKAFPD